MVPAAAAPPPGPFPVERVGTERRSGGDRAARRSKRLTAGLAARLAAAGGSAALCVGDLCALYRRVAVPAGEHQRRSPGADWLGTKIGRPVTSAPAQDRTAQ